MLRIYITLFIFLALSHSTSKHEGSQAAGPVPVRQDEGFANSNELELSEIKFVCMDPKMRPFWIDLLRDESAFGEIIAIPLQKEYNCAEMLEVREIDLNSDGKNEIAIRVKGGCGSKGNCPLVIYGIFDDEHAYMRTSAGTFDFSRRKLLVSRAAMNYEVEEAKHFGYRDILLRFSHGLYGSTLELHKFDGKSYQRDRCLDEQPNGERNLTKCESDED